jgi:hypothetical protein
MSREINGIKVAHNTKDLTGLTFGRLRVIQFVGLPKHKATWLCMCECGIEKPVSSNCLLKGQISCGCLQREWAADRHRTHGRTGTPEFATWMDMKDRCRRKTHSSYLNYGARGIRVSERWSSFENFYKDMGSKPSKAHSIERTNNDGDYTPENCRWALRSEQSRNKRNNIWVDVDGERMILKDAAIKFGINYYVLHTRYCKLKWSLDRAISEPVHPKKRREV